MRVEPLLFLLLLAPLLPAEGQESYIMGEEVEAGPDLGSAHGRFVKLRDHRYSERFSVERVALPADGSEIVALTRASREGAQSWDLGSGRSRKLPPMARDAATIGWAPAKDLLAVAVMADVLSGERAGVEVLRMSDGSSVHFLIGGENSKALAFSPDGKSLAGATGQGVMLWTLPGGRGGIVYELPHGADAVTWISPSQLVVVSDSGAQVARIDRDGTLLESWKGARSQGGICLSPDGRYLVTGHEGELRVLDLWNGGPPQRVLVEGAVTSLAWSMSGEVLAAGVDLGMVHVFAVDGFAGVPWDAEPVAPRAERARPPEERREETREDDRSAARDERSAARDERGSSRRDDPLGDLRGDPDEGAGRDDRDDLDARLNGSEAEAAPDLTVALRVLVLNSSMSSDPRDARSMEGALQRNHKRLDKCWKPQLRAGKLERGKLVLEFSVNANGEAGTLQPPLEDTLGNDKVLGCLAERLREPVFGSGLGAVDVELTVAVE